MYEYGTTKDVPLMSLKSFVCWQCVLADMCSSVNSSVFLSMSYNPAENAVLLTSVCLVLLVVLFHIAGC